MTDRQTIQQDTIQSVDDLRYDLPQNILDYDKRFWLGLSAYDLVLIAMTSILATVHIALAIGAAVLCLLLVIRFDALGNRSLVSFGLGYLKHRLTRRPVVLPIILPASDESEQITYTEEDGSQYRFGGPS